VRSQRRREGLAAATLADIEGVEVYAPRIRIRRRRAGGAMWMTEALFPGYIFARFELGASLRHIQSSRGVLQVVHFGGDYQPVADDIITSLKDYVPAGEVSCMDPALDPGTQVTVVAGPFRDLEAVIVENRPAIERVKVLLQMLGSEVVADLSSENVLAEMSDVT